MVIPPSVPPARVEPRRVLAGLVVPEDLVVGVAAPDAGDLEAVADLDALHRLDAHQRLGEQAVDLAVPVHVRAEPGRHAVAEHLDHAAERVADLGRGLDLADHRGLGLGVEAAHRGVVDGGEVGRRGPEPGRGARRAHLDHVAQRPRCRARRGAAWRACPRPPGRRSRGRWPARARCGRRRSRTSASPPGRRGRAGAGAGASRWPPAPATSPPATSATRCCGSRSATGEPRVQAVADAAEELDVVALEAHPGAAPEAEAAAGELVTDLVDGDREARGEPLDDHRRARGRGTHRRSGSATRGQPPKGTVQDTGGPVGPFAHSAGEPAAVSCRGTSRGSASPPAAR